MKKINIISLTLLSAALAACGGGNGGPAKPDVCSELNITHCNEVKIPEAASSSSASSEAPPVNNVLPITETFAVDNASQFFSQAYKPLLDANIEDTNNAFYYATSGLDSGRIVASQGKLTFGNARFTLGQRLQKTGTHIDPGALPVDYKVGTTTDGTALNFPTTTTWGDLDLAHPWKISFCVAEAEALSGSTSNQQFMVYVDNNTSGSSFSIHGTKSLVKQLNVSTFVPGKRVEINIPGDVIVGGVNVDSVIQNPGTTSSFIQLRVPSAGVVTMSNLWVGYQSNRATEPAASTCNAGTRVPNWNIALPPAVPVAPTFEPGSGQLRVNWPVASGAASYTIAWNTTDSVEGATLIEGVVGTSTLITGLQNGTNYYVFIKAVNTGGVSAYGPSAVGVPAVPAVAPSVPTGLVLFGDSQRALVTWAPTDGASSYTLVMNTMNETTTATVIGNVTDTYKRVNNLVNGTPYYFFVKAVNAVGGSAYTAAQVVTPTASPYIYKSNLKVTRDQYFGVNGPAVQTISAASEVPMHYVAGSGAGITLDAVAGTITLASGGRFTIGQPVAVGGTQVNTTSADTSVLGSLDLSGHYKIYITVVSAPDNAGVLQVYLDNNTTGSANSMLLAKSRLLSKTVSGIADGEVIEIDVSGDNRLGTANSFLQFRVDSAVGAEGVVISGIRIEAVDAPVGSSSSSVASSVTSSVASSSSSSSVASSVASSSSSSVASSAASSSSSSTSSAVGGSSSSAAGALTAWVPTYTSLQTAVVSDPLATATNANFNATPTPISVGGLNFYSASAGSLRLNSDGTVYSINYNGTSLKSDVVLVEGTSGQVDPKALNTGIGVTRYVSIPFAGTATPVTVEVTYSNSSASACINGQVALVDQTGKTWKVASACSGTNVTMSATIADASVTELFILMPRGGDSSGGIRIWQVNVTK